MKVNIKNLQDKLKLKIPKIKKTVKRIFKLSGIKRKGELTICLVDDKQIKELNLLYLGRYSPTDVLSFNLTGNNQEFLADIIISVETAMRNAKIFKKALLDELNLYIIHGILHLFGYDDKTPKEKKIMQAKTNSILKNL